MRGRATSRGSRRFSLSEQEAPCTLATEHVVHRFTSSLARSHCTRLPCANTIHHRSIPHQHVTPNRYANKISDQSVDMSSSVSVCLCPFLHLYLLSLSALPMSACGSLIFCIALCLYVCISVSVTVRVGVVYDNTDEDVPTTRP